MYTFIIIFNVYAIFCYEKLELGLPCCGCTVENKINTSTFEYHQVRSMNRQMIICRLLQQD